MQPNPSQNKAKEIKGAIKISKSIYLWKQDHKFTEDQTATMKHQLQINRCGQYLSNRKQSIAKYIRCKRK